MPHIHTEPGQHDITASAWIIRNVDDVPHVLVHMHRKHGKLMQIGGHIEPDETPWQTMGHEIPEESGFTIKELKVLQPLAKLFYIKGAAVHPVPALSNTHKVSADHYHSDYGYVFLAEREPKGRPANGESQDLRWMTVSELKQAAINGEALSDVADIYEIVVNDILPAFVAVDASVYTLSKPDRSLKVQS